MPLFGQLVIGPPGSGKTTYCHAMHDLLDHQLHRKTSIVNLDPANENLPYKPDVDVSELVNLNDVMTECHLGPNGGLVAAVEYLEQNFEWLQSKLEKLGNSYLLIDCPGQIELYTHNDALKNIFKQLASLDLRLCAVNLVDSHYCSDASKFISVCLTSLNMMLQIEMPHINILSKIDLVEKFAPLQFNIDFYTEVLDLKHLTDTMADDPFLRKYKKLNIALKERDVIEGYGLVSFLPLQASNKERLLNIRNAVDKANGFVFGSSEERTLSNLTSFAMQNNEFEYERIGEIRERFMNTASDENQNTDVESKEDDLDKLMRAASQI